MEREGNHRNTYKSGDNTCEREQSRIMRQSGLGVSEGVSVSLPVCVPLCVSAVLCRAHLSTR